MLKVEKQTPGGYIILNIWDDDHYRNLDAWRSIRFGYGSRCGFTLPHLRVDVAKHSNGEPRFDQSFVDWLKHRPCPVVDMCTAFAADYQRYKIAINDYLAPYYNGHHTPRGNVFTAWALKDAVVEWLNPKPPPYR